MTYKPLVKRVHLIKMDIVYLPIACFLIRQFSHLY